jgi:hypothetical protein
MITKKYRLFGIINPVDILILSAVVCLVWFASIFSAPRQAIARTGDPFVIYTIELGAKEEGFHTNIQPGAVVFDSLRGFDIGRVVNAYGLPYREDAPDEVEGVFRRAIVDGMEFTYIEVETFVQKSDYAISIGQYDIAVNKEVFVRSKHFAGQGYITAIQFID